MFQNRLFYITLTIIGLFFIWFIAAPTDSGANNSQAQASLTNQQNFAMGDPNANVKITQYSDFLCPSCSQVSLGIMPRIVKEYVDTGKAYFEFRPLAFIASGSQTAAEGAFCAADQNKFWQYHDTAYNAVWTEYFSKGVDPSMVLLYSVDGVKTIGKVSGVEQDSFNSCMDNHDKRQEVIDFTKTSQENGITGTPYFIVNDTPIKGVPTYEILDAAIKSKL